MTSIFSNREIASAGWLGLALIFAIAKTEIRQSLVSVLKALSHWKLVVPVVLMAAYSAAIVYGLWRLGLWRFDELKDTVFWFFFAALPLAFSAVNSAQNERHFWRRAVFDQVKVVVLIEWLFSTYTFSLVTELILAPLLFLLFAMDAIARIRPEYGSVARITGTLLGIVGVTVFVQTVRYALASFHLDQSSEVLRSMALAPILSLALLPVTYLLVLATVLELLFVRLAFWKANERRWAAYAAIRISWYCRFRPSKMNQFWRAYLHHFTGLRAKADVDLAMRHAASRQRYPVVP